MRPLPNALQDADELIRRVLARRRGMFDPADFDDLRAEVTLRLVRRLDDPDGDPIDSLPDYVAMVTYHVVDDYGRRRHPERARLSNRVRFTLTRDERFALWESGRELIGGLRSWRERAAIALPEAVVDLEDIPGSLLRLFDRAGAPLAFQAIVSLFWKASGEATHEHDRAQILEAIAPPAPEQSDLGEQLWREILELPPRQRVALLLHLRDDNGESALVHVGLASLASAEEIASALEMPLAEFRELWNDLPLDDRTIAARLGITRQQVINLRKCARERLARRMARW